MRILNDPVVMQSESASFQPVKMQVKDAKISSRRCLFDQNEIWCKCGDFRVIVFFHQSESVFVWGETKPIQSTANRLLFSESGRALWIFHREAFGVALASAIGPLFSIKMCTERTKLELVLCHSWVSALQSFMVDDSAFPPCKLPLKAILKMSTKVVKEILCYLTFFFYLWSLNRILKYIKCLLIYCFSAAPHIKAQTLWF